MFIQLAVMVYTAQSACGPNPIPTGFEEIKTRTAPAQTRPVIKSKIPTPMSHQ